MFVYYIYVKTRYEIFLEWNTIFSSENSRPPTF